MKPLAILIIKHKNYCVSSSCIYYEASISNSQAIERLRKEILNIAKQRERLEYKLDSIDQRMEKQNDAIRLTNLEKMTNLNWIVSLEGKLIQSKEKFREHLRKVYKIELEIIKLEGTVEENEQEKKRTRCQGLHYQSEFLMRAYKKIQQRLVAKNFQVRTGESLIHATARLHRYLGTTIRVTS